MASADLGELKILIGPSRPVLLPVDLPVSHDVIQINRVTHTGASGYHRLAFPAIFDGVTRVNYLLVGAGRATGVAVGVVAAACDVYIPAGAVSQALRFAQSSGAGRWPRIRPVGALKPLPVGTKLSIKAPLAPLNLSMCAGVPLLATC